MENVGTPHQLFFLLLAIFCVSFYVVIAESNSEVKSPVFPILFALATLILFYRSKRKNNVKFLSIASALIIIVLVLNVEFVQRTYNSIYGSNDQSQDENFWVGGSFFYHLLFQEMDLSNPEWYSPIAYVQPPVVFYVYGFSMSLSSNGCLDTPFAIARYVYGIAGSKLDALDYVPENSDTEVLRRFYGEIASQKEAYARVNYLPQVVTCRHVSFFFEVASSLLFYFLITEYLGNHLGGALASHLYLTNSNLYSITRMAVGDSITYFFTLVFMIIFILLINRLFENKKRFGKDRYINRSVVEDLSLPALSAGISLSLALSTKLIVWPLIVVAFLVFLLVFLDGLVGGRSGYVSVSLVVCIMLFLTSVLSAIAINPTLHQDPIGGGLKYLEYRFLLQKGSLTHIVQIPEKTIPQKVEIIYSRGIRNFLPSDASPYLYGVTEKIKPYKTFLSLLLFLGLLEFLRSTVKEIMSGGSLSHATVLIWMTVTLAFQAYFIQDFLPRWLIIASMSGIILLCTVADKAVNGLDGLSMLLIKVVKSRFVRPPNVS